MIVFLKGVHVKSVFKGESQKLSKNPWQITSSTISYITLKVYSYVQIGEIYIVITPNLSTTSQTYSISKLARMPCLPTMRIKCQS